MPRRPHELFVISDLHIGGRAGSDAERGSCINTHMPLLTQFVHAVAARSRALPLRVELVINGDFFDFLAEEVPSGSPWSAFIADADEALQVFTAIRARHRPFFKALRALLRAGADLTLLLGNHDLELSLPAVRAELLAGLRTSGHGRVRFVYDGEAHGVGDVLIEHGNRYDGYNVVDFDGLREHRSALSRRGTLAAALAFEPPVGSRLVESVMNPIKRDYGFIDLLKPENEAVVPLLVALDPGLLADMERLWRLARLKREAGFNTSKTPGEPAWASQIGVPQAGSAGPGSVLREMLADTLDSAELAQLEALAAEAEAAPASQIGALDGLRRAWSLLRQQVGGFEWDRRMNILLAALRRLQHDLSFDPGWETESLKQHVMALGRRGFAVVVLGHTHLARQMSPAPGLVYLNTGTWADLMRLPAGLFDADARVARQVLDGFVVDLRAHHYTPYLAFTPSYAHVVVNEQGHAVSARLHRYDAAQALLS